MWSAPWEPIERGSYTWVCEGDKSDVYRWTEGALVVQHRDRQYRVQDVPRVWYDAATRSKDDALLLLNAAAGQRLFDGRPVMSGELHQALGTVAAQTAITLRRGSVHLLQSMKKPPEPTKKAVEECALGVVAFAHSASHIGSGQLADDPSPRLIDMAVSNIAGSMAVTESQITHAANGFREQANNSVLGQSQRVLACARTWRVPSVEVRTER